MRKLLLLLCVMLMLLAGCMAKTQATLTYDALNKPIITIFDNKSRQGFTLDVEQNEKGLPDIHYKAEVVDANAVAMEALGLAKTATGMIVGAAEVAK